MKTPRKHQKNAKILFGPDFKCAFYRHNTPKNAKLSVFGLRKPNIQ